MPLRRPLRRNHRHREAGHAQQQGRIRLRRLDVDGVFVDDVNIGDSSVGASGVSIVGRVERSHDAELRGLAIELFAVVELHALAQLELEGQIVKALPLRCQQRLHGRQVTIDINQRLVHVPELALGDGADVGLRVEPLAHKLGSSPDDHSARPACCRPVCRLASHQRPAEPRQRASPPRRAWRPGREPPEWARQRRARLASRPRAGLAGSAGLAGAAGWPQAAARPSEATPPIRPRNRRRVMGASRWSVISPPRRPTHGHGRLRMPAGYSQITKLSTFSTHKPEWPHLVTLPSAPLRKRSSSVVRVTRAVLYFAQKPRERPVRQAVEVGIPHFFCCQARSTAM